MTAERTAAALFLEWATKARRPLSTVTAGPPWDDLTALGDVIGDVPLVALSEGVHGAAEPLDFRNRVFRYLVEEKGFTTIAIESGIVESRAVHDYVRGGPGDLSTVVAQGFSWTFDRLPQNLALVRWLREYNADPGHTHDINFYGFDLPGSPGNPRVVAAWTRRFAAALEYLGQVDPSQLHTFQARLDGLLPNLRFNFCRPLEAPGYDRLGSAERDVLTATIADLVNYLERSETAYTAIGTQSDYEWAYRAALAARQADQWLRQIPLGWRPSQTLPVFPSEETQFYAAATDVRDRAQANNLEWIIEREGAAAKVLIFASRFHLSAAPVKTRWTDPDGPGQIVAGTYLRQRYAGRLVTIGNLIGGGEYSDGESRQPLEPAAPQSIEGLAAEIETPRFLLDLRTAPAPVQQWLDQEHSLGSGDAELRLNVAKAFDALYYIDIVSAA